MLRRHPARQLEHHRLCPGPCGAAAQQRGDGDGTEGRARCRHEGLLGCRRSGGILGGRLDGGQREIQRRSARRRRDMRQPVREVFEIGGRGAGQRLVHRRRVADARGGAESPAARAAGSPRAGRPGAAPARRRRSAPGSRCSAGAARAPRRAPASPRRARAPRRAAAAAGGRSDRRRRAARHRSCPWRPRSSVRSGAAPGGTGTVA